MTYKVVVPVSGGKDSQACLKLAIEHHNTSEVLGLFCDTQFEHPETYKHVEWMRNHYGVRIDSITAGSVDDKVIKYGRFPGGGARHCTEELKMVPSKVYYKELANSQGGFEVWLGMRLDESPARQKRYKDRIDTDLYPPHEVFRKFPKYLYAKGVTFRLPILDWSKHDVFEYLDGEYNPLYSAGFSRVGCFPCLATGDSYKEQCFTYDDVGLQQRERVRKLELAIDKSIWTSKGGKKRHADDYDDGPGCSFCSM